MDNGPERSKQYSLSSKLYSLHANYPGLKANQQNHLWREG